MDELIHEHSARVRSKEGVAYRARVFGRERKDRTWEGWLEFEPEGGTARLRTGQETSQPSKEALVYWATGLEPVYLEGALVRTSSRAVSSRPGPRVTLTALRERLAVCRLHPQDELPGWVNAPSSFTSVTRTPDELSVVMPAHLVPADVHQERGWRVLRVEGPLPLDLVGVLSALATPLAEAGVSVFVLATFDTDYVLVRQSALEIARDALRRAGHAVDEEV